jgi:multisubunit Na+/H+ antiporter MnhB subunit
VNSIILATVSRLLTGLLLVFSVFLLLRGHNLPGGGFSGGLVAASAFVLFAFASGFPAARRVLVAPPRIIMGFGLVVAIVAGLVDSVVRIPRGTLAVAGGAGLAELVASLPTASLELALALAAPALLATAAPALFGARSVATAAPAAAAVTRPSSSHASRSTVARADCSVAVAEA